MPGDIQAYTLTTETFIYKQIYCYPHAADTQDKTPRVKYVHKLDMMPVTPSD